MWHFRFDFWEQWRSLRQLAATQGTLESVGKPDAQLVGHAENRCKAAASANLAYQLIKSSLPSSAFVLLADFIAPVISK